MEINIAKLFLALDLSMGLIGIVVIEMRTGYLMEIFSRII